MNPLLTLFYWFVGIPVYTYAVIWLLFPEAR